MPMRAENFWYIAAASNELGLRSPIARTILDEWLVLFRDQDGKAVALRDRCLHRSVQLSRGRVRNGNLKCPYHGWTYNGTGRVVAVPSEGKGPPRIGKKCAPLYPTQELDGYIYVCLDPIDKEPMAPFRIKHYQERGWRSVRLSHIIQNSVTNCVENFVDIPHTVSVHPGIFRSQKGQRISAKIERANGAVLVTYHNEADNLGLFSRFLNPSGQPISHIDAFYVPNVTQVDYNMGPNRQCIITSQSVPIAAQRTAVYTDVTYNYGLWNMVAAPLVWLQAKVIIAQDITILSNQMATICRYSDRFNNSPADVIHTLIESLRDAITQGKDPRELPKQTKHIEFWV